jgi:type VI secretion system secreted protein VgrG
MPKAQAQQLKDAARQLQKTIDDSNRALLAADAYKDPPGGNPPAPGFNRLSDDDLTTKLHLDPSMFHPQDSGFRAAVYENDSKTPPQYVLAFKGTTPDSPEDWENNLAQGVGLDPDYYQRARQLGTAVKQSTGGNLTVTGHSLGGGLASAAAVSSHLKGSTYNSSGLSHDTVVHFPDTGDRLLTAYQVKGEPLTGLQSVTDGALPSAVGSPVPVDPPPGAGLFDKHSMDSVLYGMDQQGTAQEAQLTSLMPKAAAAGAR